MKPNEFECFLCKGIFEKDWSDEEALKELKSVFDKPVEECELVCDDCYRMIGLGPGRQ